jgi:two-component sensor histidine kinase
MAAVRATCVFALVCYILLVLLVLRRARRRPEARYFLFYLASMMVWQASQTVAAFTTHPGVALWGYRLVLAFAGPFGFFYALFVRELLGIRSARWFISIGWLFTLLMPLYVVLGGPGMITGVYQEPDWPLYLPTVGDPAVLAGSIAYLFLLYALFHLIRAQARSTSAIERNRLTYLTIGIPIVIVGTAANYFPETRGYPVDIAAHVVNAFLTAYVILRYRLLDIQLVVRKGLRYSITTVAISGIYFLLVSLSVQVLHLVSNVQVLLLSVVMAILAAIIVEPLRDWLQARVDRQFFREKYDAARMLQRVSRSSAALLDVEKLAAMILAEVVNTMHIQRAAIFVKDQAGAFRMVASEGLPPGERWSLRADNPIVTYLAQHRDIFASGDLDRVPMAHGLRLEERERWDTLQPDLLAPIALKHSLVGLVAVGPKLSGLDYSPDDCAMLMMLADQAAVAVENARLYAAVQSELVEREAAEARLIESLQEKEVMLKEIHHRVKNNLQVIYSLLSLQAQHSLDPAVTGVLRDSQNRIRSMALIHEKLYQSANLAEVDFGEYLRTLASNLHRSYATSDRMVRLVVNTAPIRLPLDTALPCALIASELISNALKHAFVGRDEGVVRVLVCRGDDDRVQLEVADDGVGISGDAAVTRQEPAPLGMQLVRGLVRQLDGTIEVTNGVGACFTVTFRARS